MHPSQDLQFRHVHKQQSPDMALFSCYSLCQMDQIHWTDAQGSWKHFFYKKLPLEMGTLPTDDERVKAKPRYLHSLSCMPPASTVTYKLWRQQMTQVAQLTQFVRTRSIRTKNFIFFHPPPTLAKVHFSHCSHHFTIIYSLIRPIYKVFRSYIVSGLGGRMAFTMA